MLALRVSYLVALVVAGCTFDSRMLQEPQTQRTAASDLTPKLEAKGKTPQRQLHALKMRAYVTRQHAVESPAWKDHLEARIEAANGVLASELGARLELESVRPWSLADSGDSLEKPLSALQTLDAGDDVDFVLGLVASQPKLSFSFHELGMSRLFGKHLILRAANDARELDAIEKSFTALDAAERQKLYRARRAHKAASVLLHELAHSLGAPHTRDAKSILSARYTPEISGFGEAASHFLGIAFRDRFGSKRDDRAMAKELAAELRRAPDAWDTAEREHLVRELEAFANARPESASANAAPTPAGPEELSPADRARLSEAQRALQMGDAAAAWTSGAPLFDRYPDVYEVQDLRCNIAMRRALPYDAVRAECKRLMELSPGTENWK